MNIIAPEHIKKYCCRDESDSIYQKLLEEYEDENNSVCKIKCSCGCSKFSVYVDPNPTVEVVCTQCAKRITVYDLIYYPAATKCPHDDDEFSMVTSGSDSEFEVYAVYEYPDDRDSEDDISWCTVYAGADNELMEIINDETA